MSYGSEQATPREVLIQREIMAIKDNTQKYQRYLELTAKRTNSIAFTIPRGRLRRPHKGRMVKELEWIEMARLAVCSILFKSLSLKLPEHLQSSFHDSLNESERVQNDLGATPGITRGKRHKSRRDSGRWAHNKHIYY
jgi:hypothetical protein